MKKGFTLAEVLITLGIIGIVAAVCAPAISNLRPNEYKTKYMKAYNTLTTLIPEILSDEELYWPSYDDGRPSCEDLTCRQQPRIAPYNAAGPFGVNADGADRLKFAKILASKLNLQGNPVTRGNIYEFRTQDGTYWAYLHDWEGNLNPNIGQQIEYQDIIYIDVDTNNDNNNNNGRGFYSADNTNPHRFAFGLNHDGGLIPLDRMGQAYLANPTDMHNIQSDRNYAALHNTPANDFHFNSRINDMNTFINDTGL